MLYSIFVLILFGSLYRTHYFTRGLNWDGGLVCLHFLKRHAILLYLFILIDSLLTPLLLPVAGIAFYKDQKRVQSIFLFLLKKDRLISLKISGLSWTEAEEEFSEYTDKLVAAKKLPHRFLTSQWKQCLVWASVNVLNYKRNQKKTLLPSPQH